MLAFCHDYHARVAAANKSVAPEQRGTTGRIAMNTQVTGLALTLSLMAGAAAAEGSLALYNWGDYINPDVLTKFTEETGIAVTLDTYSSNEEMLAKIQAGATGYDIVFPSVHMNDIMIKLGLLEKTGINAHPDFANIDPAFLRAKEDPASEYCLP
jgi:spermidine/putrescine transport system substrate-binding protein